MAKDFGIINRKPVNKLAALAVSGGVNYEPDIKLVGNDSENQIQIRKGKRCDLFLTRRGRLVVLGYAYHVRGRLVVRCDCGVFLLRTAKAIKNKGNDEDACQRCRHQAHLRWKTQHRQKKAIIDEGRKRNAPQGPT